jgi:hypothetical protein
MTSDHRETTEAVDEMRMNRAVIASAVIYKERPGITAGTGEDSKPPGAIQQPEH